MFRMIIADDEPGIRNGLRDLFPWETLDIKIVFLAANGRAVLDYLKNNPADIILADIRMPVMDGLELSHILKDSYPNVCTILLSAYTDFEYARTALRYGVREYITKPVDYDTFLSTFRRILTQLSPPPKAESASYQGYYAEIAQLVIRYVNENLSTATLLGAAERVGLSANYLSNIFREVHSETFSDYLSARRMEAALLLLQQGATTEDAAWKVGYSSTRCFKRAFFKHFGQSPHTYLTFGAGHITEDSTHA